MYWIGAATRLDYEIDYNKSSSQNNKIIKSKTARNQGTRYLASRGFYIILSFVLASFYNEAINISSTSF